MLVTILTVVGLLALLTSFGVVLLQNLNIKRGNAIIDSEFNGPKQVSIVLHVILRYLIRRSIHFRKFATQYALHLFVRVLYYLDKFSTYLYAKSRDAFVSTAVKNRGTVPHFWNHLKVYKQEMDKEKEDK